MQRTFTGTLKSFGQRGTLQSDIDMVHKKLPPKKCQECKKSFRCRRYLQSHIKTAHKIKNVHKKLTL